MKSIFDRYGKEVVAGIFVIIAALISGIFLWISNRPTPTPPPTFTQQAVLPTAPSLSPSNTALPIVAPTQIPPTNSLGSTPTPMTSNTQWTPITQSFNGVDMVLVPVGCFEMGSRLTKEEVIPHEQCFSQPFWIDKTEVTNAQFNQFSGQAAKPSRWTDTQRPRERITWFEATDFCAQRGTRLPTEREWEYAARGPSNLKYPWGNVFVADNVVNGNFIHQQTAAVGSKPNGAAWVGALDMSGNVKEWISTLYKSYPYDPNDGRENNSDTTSRRVLRGGSWWDDDNVVRAAFRSKNIPTLQDHGVGFRCARNWDG